MGCLKVRELPITTASLRSHFDKACRYCSLSLNLRTEIPREASTRIDRVALESSAPRRQRTRAVVGRSVRLACGQAEPGGQPRHRNSKQIRKATDSVSGALHDSDPDSPEVLRIYLSDHRGVFAAGTTHCSCSELIMRHLSLPRFDSPRGRPAVQ